MKALWEHGGASFEGKRVRFPEVRCDPLPVQRPHPPVLIGAPASERTFRRIAGVGDGWLPVMDAPEEVERGRRAIKPRCGELGRDASAMETRSSRWRRRRRRSGTTSRRAQTGSS